MNKKRMVLYCILAAVCVLTFSLASCGGGESATVNVAVYSSTPSCSLYFTALVNDYFASLDTYVFFSGGISMTVDKMNRDKLQSACVLSYVTVPQLKDVFKDGNKESRVVLIDNYDSDGKIAGVWVARSDWAVAAPNTYKKALKALLRAADYRAENTAMSYAEALSSVEHGYNMKNIKDVMQYIAVYEKDNGCKITDAPFSFVDAGTLLGSLRSFADGGGEGYDSCVQAYRAAFGVTPTDDMLNGVFDFSGALGIDLTEEPDTGKDAPLGKTVPVIVFSVIGLGALLIISKTVKLLILERRGYAEGEAADAASAIEQKGGAGDVKEENGEEAGGWEE